MSFPGYEWAWGVIRRDGDKMPGKAQVLALRLGHHANKNLLAWPGNGKLATALKTDERTVERHLRRFEKDGLIVRSPYMKPEGRGRGYDRIRLIPASAATRQNDPPQNGDQPDILDAATRQNDPQQPDKMTPGSSIREPTEGTDREPTGENGRPAKLPSVDADTVTEAEWQKAVAAIERFNQRNGSKLGLVGTTGKATEALKRIVCRIREHPELSADDLARIVDRNFDAPWWKEPKLGGVGPIFGPKAWPRAMACDGVARSNRTVRRDLDRRGAAKGPDW